MKKKKESKTLIFAHRGACNLAHENTMEAFKKAYELNANGIELDLRKTKDNIIIVNHNPNVDDLVICENTYECLTEYTQKQNYIMPKFEDVVNEFGGKIFLDIEIKEPGFENEVIDLMLNKTTQDMFMIRSFNKDIIIKVKEINKKITTALILGEKHLKYGIFSRIFDIFPKKHIKKTNCDIISPYKGLLMFSYLKRMKKLGIKVSVWTVNSPKLMKKLINANVDYIITNYPDIALSIKKTSENNH